ncbi:MAG: hypothetical protein AB1486_24225 [Planctomycetota bacterium]
MRRNPFLLPVFSAALVVLSGGDAIAGFRGGPAQDEGGSSGKIDLRILYVGRPGSAREGDFTSFLKEHFAAVGTADLLKFRPADAKGYDVTLLDYDPNDEQAPLPKLRSPYVAATLTLGMLGARLGDSLKLKTGFS